jgi:hypothetical protein
MPKMDGFQTQGAPHFLAVRVIMPSVHDLTKSGLGRR